MIPQPFDLNLRHLAAVPAIVARRTMSAAAMAVSLSQPALTQGLAKLETQLGRDLFQRRPDGMTATAAGTMLAVRVEAALRHLAGVSRGLSRPERVITATQLRSFLALADAGSFLGAAARTGLSQPAIHRAARDLEHALCTPLAERRGRGVALTHAGRRMARGARLAAVEIAAAIAELAQGPGPAGLISVGAMPLCRARLLPHALARFVLAAPGAAVSVVEGSWRELVEPLRDGAIDLMIGALRDAPAPPDLVQAPLFVDRLIVVGGPDHPLAGHPAPTRAMLAAYPWIVGPEGSPLRLLWERLFAAPERPDHPIACGSVMAIRGILRETACLTLLSPEQVTMEMQAGILAQVGAPLAASVRTIGITTRAGWRPTTAQSLLLRLLHEAAGWHGDAAAGPAQGTPENE